MRANEFITETINSDILNPKFKHQQQIGDFIYTAQSFDRHDIYGGPRQGLLITCYHSGLVNPNFVAGYAEFAIHNKKGKQWLESNDTNVYKDFRNQNIASTMYAYAKMLGNDIKPSTIQLRPGKKMWKSWKDSGEVKHLTK